MDEGGTDPETLGEVDPAQAVALIERGAVLVDVRELEEWLAGHAPNASHLALSQFSERWRELPADRTVIVVCRSGHRSAQATGALRGQQIAARNLAGGMLAWEQAGLSIVDAAGLPGSII